MVAPRSGSDQSVRRKKEAADAAWKDAPRRQNRQISADI
jgi:hypothetical protein